MIANVLATTPLTDVNFPSVWTSMLDAAATEDDEQYFAMLEIVRAFSLDTITGTDLDDRAAESSVSERRSAKKASTTVTLGDTAVTKISTGVYSGKPGPAATTSAINGDSATGFLASGSIIIGRGTPNAETVPYSSISVFANYVTFNLSAALAFDHGTDETIIRSQGGNRLINAGVVVFVPSSDISEKIEFILDSAATILDGERVIENVQVTAVNAGASSNVPIGSIREYDSNPFSTATVTNPSRVTNGRDVETDQELRDRIKSTIQSLSRGTGTAIITGALGLISGNQRVVSASIVEPTLPADVVKLYIDDGAGSPFTFENIGFEQVLAAATGGEKFLNVDNVPLVKAFVETISNAPFTLFGGEILFVDVGGVVETITFESADFLAPGAATAQEVLTRINASASLFESRISVGDKIRIFARANFQEEIQVTGGTANTALAFPTDNKFTTKLFLERDFELTLLSKDGRTATIESGSAEAYDLSGEIKSFQIVADGKIDNPISVFLNPTSFVDAANATAEEVCALVESQSPGISCEASSNDTKFRLTSKTTKDITSKIRVVGTFDQVWNEEGGSPFVERTADSKGVATYTLFGADLDYIYLGHSDVKFNVVFPIFNTVSSADVGAVYEQWDGAIWRQLGVADNTNGFQQDGYISLPNNPRWVKTSVNGSINMYFLRIQRNNAAAITAPIIERFVISSSNLEFAFDETEIVGANKDYTLNRFIGQIELESPSNVGDRLTLGSLITRAFVTTTVNGNYALFGGEVFDIEIDGVFQTYTFLVGDFTIPGSATPAEVAIALNRELGGITSATVDSGLKVEISTNKMNGGSLKVLSSTANAILLFSEIQSESFIPHLAAVESGSAEPYSFATNDTLIVIIDGALGNNTTVPVFFGSLLTAVTSPSIVIDTGLNVTFPLDTDLVGYEIEMIDGAQAGVRRVISTYVAATGTITTTAGFPGAPSIGDSFQILPVDADKVVRFLNNKLITTISSRAEIKTSSGGVKVQIATLNPGEDGSVQVSGGGANAVLNFPVTKSIGVDGYRYYSNLAQFTQQTIDGIEGDEDFQGIRAAGVQVEVSEAVTIPIFIDLDVTTEDGVTLNSISNEIKTAVSNYINNLGVRDDVIRTQIECAVKDVVGVFDIEVTRLDPASVGSRNIAIADNERARINEGDIVVG